jgi:signal transduction histidine kinase
MFGGYQRRTIEGARAYPHSVFEKFQQLDSSVSRSYEGLGLGLYVAEKFTELLGGELSVSTALGRGSTFTVALPVT